MGKKNRKNIGKALKKEGGEDKIKLGIERDMEVVPLTSACSTCQREKV
jgi:hypothetical protein